MHFTPPLAGAILGRLIDIFALRSWDTANSLSQTNTRRFLRGERVSDDAVWTALRAVAAVVLASGLVPAAVSTVVSTTPLGRVFQHVKPRDVLVATLSVHARRWDELAGAMRRFAAPVDDDHHAPAAYLRLVTIDLAVRIGALLWLLRGPRSELPAPTWAETGGASRYLKGLLERCGARRPTRDQITEALGLDDKTVDGWLDHEIRPADTNIKKLATLLASRGAGLVDDLAREIAVVFSLRALADAVAEAVGYERMLGMAGRLVGYANFFPHALTQSKMPRDVVDESMRLAFLGGTFPHPPPWVAPLLGELLKLEDDPVWQADLAAVTGSWFERLREVASRLTFVETTPEARAQVEAELERGDFEALRYASQARGSVLFESDAATRAKIEESLAADPTARQKWLCMLAVEARDEGELDRAVSLVEEALELDPLDAGAHCLRGECLADADAGPACDAEAMLAFEIATQLRPEWDRPRIQNAIALINSNRVAEACKRLELAKRELLTVTPWLLFMVAVGREFADDVDGAVAAYEELLAIDDDDGEALDRLAHLYFCGGNSKKGIDRCKRAHHLGVSTVFNAWESGYYKGKAGPRIDRPPRALPQEALRVADDVRTQRRSR